MQRFPHPQARVGSEGAAAARTAPADLPEPDPRERALARTCGVPDLLARVLLARGFDCPDQVRRHLRPDLGTLADPFRFAQMEAAVARVRRAVRRGEPIVVHGDYDVDGIAGTVLLVKLFRLMGAEVRPYIPHRSDGYSFSEASWKAIKDGGFKLCISVDNGTNAAEWIERIQKDGCDVVVTDHHGTSDNVAPAHAVLNPRLPGAGYPDRELAGVGVAFCLAKAVAAAFSRGKALSEEFRTFLLDAMTYVALGTVADVAPLRGENRVMVAHGLRALAVCGNPGVRALLDCAHLGNRSPDVEDIAFRIAPLINAAGRMGKALEAVELLMAPGYQEAQEAAKVLEQHNESRRKVERRLVEEVIEEARACDDPILVLGREGWHAGVLGIVASRITELLGKPTILIAFDGERGRGSGRSAGILNLRDALAGCSHCLLAHGGHAAAVGLELERERLEEFRARINERSGHLVRDYVAVTADGCATLDELDPRTVRKLDQLGPFGAGNPRPTFASPHLKLVGRPAIDSRGHDLRFRVAQNGALLPARLKGGADRCDEITNLKERVVLTYTPRLAQWGEDGPVELLVHGIRPDDAARRAAT